MFRGSEGSDRSAMLPPADGFGHSDSFPLVPKVGLVERTFGGASALRDGWRAAACQLPPLTAKHSFPAEPAFPNPQFGNEGKHHQTP